MKASNHWLKNFKLLLLILGVVTICGLLSPTKAHADSYYADGNGNGIPDGSESALVNACNSSGGRTIWTLWPSPYYITPPAGSTNYDIDLAGAAYVCPDAPYSNITNAQFYNLAPPWFVSLDAGSFGIGGASRGNFAGPGSVRAHINLAALPVNACSSFNVGFSVSALHGGVYSAASGLTQSIQICYFPQAQATTTVGGHVYNNSTGAPMANVQIGTCMGYPNPANVWTNSSGYFGFTVNQNTGYCLRVVGGVPSGSSVSAYWYTQFPYTKYHPGFSSYEYQLAGTNCFEAGPEGNIYCGNRNQWWGFDINWPYPQWDSLGNQGMDFRVTPPPPTQTARLTVSVSGTGGGSGTFTDAGGHDIGNCLSSFVVSTSVTCTSGPGLGIGWHVASHPSGNPGGAIVQAPASINGRPFVNWTGNNYTDGNQHCVGLTIYQRCVNIPPGSSGSITANYQAIPPRLPYMTVLGGDAHAGAVLSSTITSSGCVSLSSSARIRGQRVDSNSGSRGQFGVSATSTISQLGSSALVDGTSATFGNGSPLGNFYRTVCRPDFSKLTYDKTLRSLNGGTNPSSYNLGSLPANANGKVILWETNSNKRLSGTLAAGMRVTIISMDSVRIDGNIRFKTGSTDSPNYTSADEVPALLLATRSDLLIDPAVNSITGYFVANGAISTCSNDVNNVFSPNILTSSGAAACTPGALRIYGAIAAQNIYLRRLFGDTAPSNQTLAGDLSNAGDLVLMIPELYIASPPGLNSQSGLRTFLGDLPPVF